MEYLEKKFSELWTDSGISGNYKVYFQAIEKLYNTPQRYYHTFYGHIEFCLREFEKVSHLASEPKKVLWELFLHDIIMDFGRSDNDERSAIYAKKLLLHLGMGAKFADDVATKIEHHNHCNIPQDFDNKLGLDIDLLILAQPREVFDVYENNVAKERLLVVSEATRKRVRGQILTRFLERPRIFLTDDLHDEYEDQARKNLKYSIKKLTT